MRRELRRRTIKTNLRRVADYLKSVRNVMIISHAIPDGDAVGSELALLSALREIGKEAVCVGSEPIPDRYRFLRWHPDVVPVVPADFDIECLVVLDTAVPERLGENVQSLFRKPIQVVSIDHHPDNIFENELSLVDSRASSTAELVFYLLRELRSPVGADRAACLYTGILTDTGGFTHPNTTSEALSVSASLVREGANPSEIWQALRCSNTPSRLRLLGMVLSKAELASSGKVCILYLTQDMLTAVGCDVSDAENFADYTLTIGGVSVGLLFKEFAGDEIGVSLRSHEDIDVKGVAIRFGGGGHRCAAGCRLHGTLEEVKSDVLQEIERQVRLN
jgi:phosphoesterase RecJ-like protein